MEDKTISQQVIRSVLTVPDEEFAALSVGKLAQLFEMDRYKLSRQFKCKTGMTLEDFLYKEKMTRAALLLLASRDITVKKVAERIGFCSPDYFIRKFRQFYGIVPGKYKEYKTQRSGMGNHNHHENSNQVWHQGQEQLLVKARETKSGNSCENCFFRKFALNFDDLK